jgi:thiamine-phosphate pyrophosphorylase
VRELWGPARLLGLSTHSLYDVTEADQEPVDYIGFGPIFDSTTKDVEGFGVELLHSSLDAATRPVFGIGGITPDNLTRAVDAGLDRIAVSSAICGARDPGAVVTRLLAILDGE